MASAAFVFGDVHGDVVRLRNLIGKARRESERRGITDLQLYSVGDLVDRGPSSKEVIQVCIDEKVLPILGNHELWLHQFCATGQFDDMALQPAMSGIATLRSYGIDSRSPGEIERRLRADFPQAHREYILSMPVWRKVKLGSQIYRLIHSGLLKSDAEQVRAEILKNFDERGIGFIDVPEEDIEDYTLEIIARAKPSVLLWVGPKKKQATRDLHRGLDGSTQIFGHIPWPGGAEIGPHWIALDTGCGTCPPYKLSGVFLTEKPLDPFDPTESSIISA